MMNREIGFGRKVLQILEEEFVPFEHMPSGIDDISIIIKKKYLDDDKKAVLWRELLRNFALTALALNMT